MSHLGELDARCRGQGHWLTARVKANGLVLLNKIIVYKFGLHRQYEMNKEDIRHLIESGILSMRGEFLRTPKQLNLPLTEDGLLSIEFESDHVDVEKVIELTINLGLT